MTLLDFEELVGYWREHPPLHLLAAAWLAVGSSKKRERKLAAGGPPVTNNPGFDSLLGELGYGFVAADVHVGLDRVILDFAELKRNAGVAD